MAVSDYQYSVLSEIGIPVWVRRETTETSSDRTDEVTVTDNIQPLTLNIPDETRLIIVVENKSIDAVEQRLLMSILKAIKLDKTPQHIIETVDLSLIGTVDMSDKKMIIMTETDISFSEEINYIQIPSLSAMARQAHLKSVAWQVLKPTLNSH